MTESTPPVDDKDAAAAADVVTSASSSSSNNHHRQPYRLYAFGAPPVPRVAGNGFLASQEEDGVHFCHVFHPRQLLLAHHRPANLTVPGVYWDGVALRLQAVLEAAAQREQAFSRWTMLAVILWSICLSIVLVPIIPNGILCWVLVFLLVLIPFQIVLRTLILPKRTVTVREAHVQELQCIAEDLAPYFQTEIGYDLKLTYITPEESGEHGTTHQQQQQRSFLCFAPSNLLFSMDGGGGNYKAYLDFVPMPPTDLNRNHDGFLARVPPAWTSTTTTTTCCSGQPEGRNETALRMALLSSLRCCYRCGGMVRWEPRALQDNCTTVDVFRWGSLFFPLAKILSDCQSWARGCGTWTFWICYVALIAIPSETKEGFQDGPYVLLLFLPFYSPVLVYYSALLWSMARAQHKIRDVVEESQPRFAEIGYRLDYHESVLTPSIDVAPVGGYTDTDALDKTLV